MSAYTWKLARGSGIVDILEWISGSVGSVEIGQWLSGQSVRRRWPVPVSHSAAARSTRTRARAQHILANSMFANVNESGEILLPDARNDSQSWSLRVILLSDASNYAAWGKVDVKLGSTNL